MFLKLALRNQRVKAKKVKSGNFKTSFLFLIFNRIKGLWNQFQIAEASKLVILHLFIFFCFFEKIQAKQLYKLGLKNEDFFFMIYFLLCQI